MMCSQELYAHTMTMEDTYQIKLKLPLYTPIHVVLNKRDVGDCKHAYVSLIQEFVGNSL